MEKQDGAIRQTKILDDIIDNAITLPVESQDLLLMMAKAMRHTRNCIMRQRTIEQPRKPPSDCSA